MNDNKKIALNTTILYIKLAISVIIGLYTSRIILLSLGVDDYGLYSVVGGIVTIMNFLGASMLSTSYRFLAIEMGKGENGNLNKIYNTVFITHVVLAIFLIVVGETIGVYYINNYLNVEPQKIPDALYVLHWSLISSAFVVISVPSNGLIIAREKFLFTTSVEIGRSILKLLMVIGLNYYSGNKLRLFAIIMVIFNLILPICYTLYCFIKEKKIVKFKLNTEWKSYKEIISYALWIMIGSLATMLQTQGAIILVNSFFTLAMNAAYGIANQVNSYIQMLGKSLGQATVPQIMKSYSAGNKGRTMFLVFVISKYSFFLMLFPSISLLISIENILKIWLSNVPQYSTAFILCMLINGLVYTLECGFDSAIQATGKIKLNQIGFSIISLSVFPTAFILYKLGAPAYTITMVSIIASIANIIFHSFILRRLTNFRFKDYYTQTLKPAFKVLIFTILVSIYLRYEINIENIWLSVVLKTIISLLSTSIIIMIFGINKAERDKIRFIIKKKFKY